MIEIRNALMEMDYVKIFHENPEQMAYGAPHHFTTKSAGSGEYLGEIKFQKGAIKEVGVNGVSNEALLTMVLIRLEAFNRGEHSCKENAEAITAIEEALMWLKKRTLDRQMRGVEGTSRK